MSQFHLQISVSGIALAPASGVLAAELSGYRRQLLLQLGSIPAPGHWHLTHRQPVYGPGQPRRSPDQLDATLDRVPPSKIGVGWLAPSAIIRLLTWALKLPAQLPAIYQPIPPGTLLGWSILFSSDLDQGLHLEGLRTAGAPLVRNRFPKSRRLRDLDHHHPRNHRAKHDHPGIAGYLLGRVPSGPGKTSWSPASLRPQSRPQARESRTV